MMRSYDDKYSCRYILITKVIFKKYLIYFREKMAQAYDFALDKIGMEIMSYQVELKNFEYIH